MKTINLDLSRFDLDIIINLMDDGDNHTPGHADVLDRLIKAKKDLDKSYGK